MKTLLDPLLNGETRAVSMNLAGEYRSVSGIDSALIFPGSFNPIHQGHEEMFQIAQELTGRDGYLEISLHNVDKSALTVEQLEARLNALRGRYRVVLTCAPRFTQKAALFNDSVFLMGHDTAKRLLDPAYSGDATVSQTLADIRRFGCSFLVAGRVSQHRFETVESLTVPVECIDMFAGISAQHFRADISSTALRNAQKN